MRLIKQTIQHDAERGVAGNCHQTAVACLLDMDIEQVPHFAQMAMDDGSDMYEYERVFLEQHGLVPIHIPYTGTGWEEIRDTLRALYSGVLYLLGGRSRLGTGHTVIMCGGSLIWDPSPFDSGIVGPMEDGFYWLTFLTPVRFTPWYGQKKEEQ